MFYDFTKRFDPYAIVPLSIIMVLSYYHFRSSYNIFMRFYTWYF